MEDRPEYLEGKEFIFKYGHLRLLPLDQLRKDEFGYTIATEQKAHRRERIVRCRDCVHGYPFCDSSSYAGMIDCLHFAQWDYYNDEPGIWPVEPDGFCAWAKPREGA